MLLKSITTGLDNSFLKHFGIVSFGKLYVFLLGIVTLPILTRLYDPSSYGHFSYLNSIILFSAALIPMAYNQAISIAITKNDKQRLAIITALLLSAGAVIMVPISHGLGFSSNKYENLILVPTAVFIVGLIDLMSRLNIRSRRYDWSAKMEISGNSITKATSLLLSGLAGSGLIIGDLIGKLSVLCFNSIKLSIFSRSNLQLLTVIRKSTSGTLIKYRNYPKYILPGILLERLSAHLPIIMVGIFFGTEQLGYLAVATTVLNAPITLISNSISPIYTTLISDLGMDRQNEIMIITKKIAIKLFVFGLLPFTIVALQAPQLIEIIVGQKWKPAGIIIQIMSIYHFAMFVISPISTVLRILGKEKAIFYYNTLQLISDCAALAVGIIFNNFIVMVSLLSIGRTIIYIFLGVLIKKNISNDFHKAKEK